MKALSIHQPWADLIVDGKRKLEIRSWTTGHRGALLIHAGLEVDWPECGRLGVTPSEKGAIIGATELISIHEITEQKWEVLRPLHLEIGPRPYGENTFGLFLKNAYRFKKPISFRGALGLFNVPDDLIPKRTCPVRNRGRNNKLFIKSEIAKAKDSAHREQKPISPRPISNGAWKIIKNGKIVESEIPGRYAGYRVDKIFGRLDCKSGMRMKKENRVFFLSWEDATAEGYRPCKNCNPTPYN